MTQRKDDVKNFWAESEDVVVDSGVPESTAEWYVVPLHKPSGKDVQGYFLTSEGTSLKARIRGPWGHDILRVSPLTSFMISSLSRVVKRLSLYTILPFIITSLTSPPAAEYTSCE